MNGLFTFCKVRYRIELNGQRGAIPRYNLDKEKYESKTLARGMDSMDVRQKDRD